MTTVSMALTGEGLATDGPHGADVALAVRGDASAFERLYRTHVARIHSLSRRMLGSEAADETTQDVFVRAWQRLHTFRGEAAFATWLHRVAVNVILERRRRSAAWRDRFADDPGQLDMAASPPAGHDLAVDMEGAIARLPPGAREIFVLHDVEGYKHREIAALLDIAVGTSKRQLHRARLLMRRHLTRRIGDA